jgi:long-chain acyl-CoA synthetase
MMKLRVGYYQGNPLKIVDDCALLKPAFFPSVPRLYNRIYGKIKGGMDAATGCKKWLINSAINKKMNGLNQNGAVAHGCYDKLVFSKVAKLLGG